MLFFPHPSTGHLYIGNPGDDGTDGNPGDDGRDGNPGPKGRQLNLSTKDIH